MTQITSIRLGLLAVCIATGPLSLAQTPRIRTSGSNQIGTTIIRTPVGPSGLSGNSTGAAQLGTNFPSGISTRPNTNFGAHIGINAGAQTGISNPTAGIIGRAAGGLSVSSGNSTSAAQTGINALSGTNTGVNTNVGAHSGMNAGAQTGINNQTGGMTTGAAASGLAGSSGNSTGATQIGANARDATNNTAKTDAGAHTAATPASVSSILAQPITVPGQTNDALSPNFSTSGPSPSPLQSASVSPTPTPTPTPAQSL